MIEELKKECKLLDSEIAFLTEKRAKVKQKMAEELCPFNIGDVLINNKGCKGAVSLIHYSYNDYEVSVTKLKKNGDPYKGSSKVYRWDGWELYNEQQDTA